MLPTSILDIPLLHFNNHMSQVHVHISNQYNTFQKVNSRQFRFDLGACSPKASERIIAELPLIPAKSLVPAMIVPGFT